MKVSVEIKIKTKSGKEVVLDGVDAKELFLELKKLYEKEKEYIPYTYPVYPQPYRWAPYYSTPTWVSSSGNVKTSTAYLRQTTPGGQAGG